tara:strand:- start:16 stop:660 length:645 start_codon:yes stop_codon:yes gene_type:complete
MTDLIIICENVDKKSEDLLMAVIKNLDKHNFKNKYLLFNGAPDLTVDKTYTNYKNYYKVNYPDYVFIENTSCINNRLLLKNFVKDNFEALSKNCLVLQSNVLLDDFDLDKLLEIKSVFNECKILYFREHRLRLNQWFNTFDDSGVLIKTHGWNEKVYLITKIDLMNLLEKDKINYYDDMIKDKCWETITEQEQLEYWQQWGCCEHKTIRHKLLN